MAIAPLLAAYGVEFGHAQRTLMEAVLTMAPLGPVRHEGARGGLRAVEAAKVIVVNNAGVLFLGDIEEVLEQIDAGVAEHDIKAVELVISGLNERIDLRSVGDIANLAPAVISAEFLRDFFKKSIVASTDDDLAAVADEAACDRAADAGRAARNHGHLTRKSVGS